MIMGNVPLDRSRDFASRMVPVDNSLSDHDIISLAQTWLSASHDKMRQTRAREMQEWILKEFGLERYVDQVARMVWAVQSGQKGMVLPWEWHEEPDVLPEDG